MLREDAWVTSWAASTSGFAGDYTAPRSTIRQTMRLSAGGRAVRLRFANPHSYAPLRFHAVTVAVADPSTPALRSAPVPVSVGGEPSFAVHPGTVVVTDPIALRVQDLETIAVSVFCDEPVAMSKHDWANRTLWGTLAAVGDRTMDADGGSFRPLGFSWLWVDAAEVLDAEVGGCLVALGDSITDGAGSDFGTDTRWPDLLAERLLALPPGDARRRAVANAGIGGNTVGGLGTELAGVNALSRLERDALSLAGVAEVLVCGGSNDLHLGATAAALVTDLVRLADRIRSAGCRPLIATIAPRIGGYLWGDEHEEHRRAVNSWIATQSVFDGVIDFAAALDDSGSPGQLRPEFDADGTHPNSTGYLEMAKAVDLDLFAPVSAGSPPAQPSAFTTTTIRRRATT